MFFSWTKVKRGAYGPYDMEPTSERDLKKEADQKSLFFSLKKKDQIIFFKNERKSDQITQKS